MIARVIIATLILFCSLTTHGEDTFLVIVKKQAKKQSDSWNLLDWMKTKKKIALMDQWFALNSSSTIFEGYLEGTEHEYDYIDGEGTTSKQRKKRGVLGLAVTILSLEFTYADSNEAYLAYQGVAGLRILGRSLQATHLAIHWGKRAVDFIGGDRFYHDIYGANANIYLLSFLGIEGLYRVYRKHRSREDKLASGALVEYGAFLDISFLRLYATLFKEKYKVIDLSNVGVLQEREGLRVGIKLFF